MRKVYILFFYIFITGTGLLSFANLMDHYINDKEDQHRWVKEQGSKFETDIAGNFFEQFEFVNLNGLMAKAIGKNELNNVIRLDNGYLYITNEECPDEDIAVMANRVIAFNEYLARRGIPLIFTINPGTSSKYDPQLPEYYVDHTNDNVDRFCYALQSRGVWVVDFREELHNDGIDAYDMMYRTDHHWNTKMGFYVYGKIADLLAHELDCDIDPKVRDINSYTIETYKKWHLGSRGQRTGKYFGGVDDFDLFVPDFDTSLTRCEDDAQGNYTSLLIDTGSLKKKDLTSMRKDVNIRSTYDRVLERSQGDFINDYSANDKCIIVTGDSFAKAVCPFMNISFAHTKWCDPVTDTDIEETKPDAVVMIFDVSGFESEGDFDFEWDETKE